MPLRVFGLIDIGKALVHSEKALPIGHPLVKNPGFLKSAFNATFFAQNVSVTPSLTS
jgi:hypothetical protein